MNEGWGLKYWTLRENTGCLRQVEHLDSWVCAVDLPECQGHCPSRGPPSKTRDTARVNSSSLPLVADHLWPGQGGAICPVDHCLLCRPPCLTNGPPSQIPQGWGGWMDLSLWVSFCLVSIFPHCARIQGRRTPPLDRADPSPSSLRFNSYLFFSKSRSRVFHFNFLWVFWTSFLCWNFEMCLLSCAFKNTHFSPASPF